MPILKVIQDIIRRRQVKTYYNAVKTIAFKSTLQLSLAFQNGFLGVILPLHINHNITCSLRVLGA